MFENWKSTTYTKPDPITDSINKIKPEIKRIFRSNHVISACLLVFELFYCVSWDSNPSALHHKCNVVPGERPNKFVLVVGKVFWSHNAVLYNENKILIFWWFAFEIIKERSRKRNESCHCFNLVFISARNCRELYVQYILPMLSLFCCIFIAFSNPT